MQRKGTMIESGREGEKGNHANVFLTEHIPHGMGGNRSALLPISGRPGCCRHFHKIISEDKKKVFQKKLYLVERLNSPAKQVDSGANWISGTHRNPDGNYKTYPLSSFPQNSPEIHV